MDEDLLARWVLQPPASPNVQYLRDAERTAAWELLGDADHVLDVASEANVTAGLDADRVTRLDFSPAASRRAADVLGEAVDRYERTTPDEPRVPTAENGYDAAVSIGPFDWKFLDTRRLLAELHRVLSPAGRAVVSVPTPRSPYARTNWPRLRYDTPRETARSFAPGWLVTDRRLLFQYPDRFHQLIDTLPDRWQAEFADVAHRLTDGLTATGAADAAAYVVVAARPMPFSRSAWDAVRCLFRDERGFWNDEENRLRRELRFRHTSDGVEWWPADDRRGRYAPFATAGLLDWRQSSLGTAAYDDRLRRLLDGFCDRIETVAADAPSYGIGPLTDALAAAADQFDDDSYAEAAERLFVVARDRFDFDHAEDSLLVYGWARLFDRRPSDRLRAAIGDGLQAIVDAQTPDGPFAFDNPTTLRHQNQMYTLWGLCRAIRVTGHDAYLENVERVLDHAVGHRMRPDGAFRWYDPGRLTRVRHRLDPTADTPQWALLFPCHQSFFVTSVAAYRAAGGRRDYSLAVRRAMSWVYGRNEWGVDLTTYGGLGVPMRFLTLDGRTDVADQQFVGAYEVGAWLAALARTADRWPVTTQTGVSSVD